MPQEDMGRGYAPTDMRDGAAYDMDDSRFEGWLDDDGYGESAPMPAPMPMPPAGTGGMGGGEAADDVVPIGMPSEMPSEMPPAPMPRPAARGPHGHGPGRGRGQAVPEELDGDSPRPYGGEPGRGHHPRGERPHGGHPRDEHPPRPRIGSPWWATLLIALLSGMLGAGAMLVADRTALYRYGPNPWPVPEAPVREAVPSIGDIEVAVHAAVGEEFEAERRANEEAAAQAAAELEKAVEESTPAADSSPDSGNLEGVEFEVPEGFSPVDGSDHEFHSDARKVTLSVTKAKVGDGGQSARAWYDAQGDSPYVRREEREVDGRTWLMAVQNLGGDEEERLFGPVTYETDTEDKAFKLVVRCTSDDDDAKNETYQPFSEMMRDFLAKVKF